jgi:hypothetical protein
MFSFLCKIHKSSLIKLFRSYIWFLLIPPNAFDTDVRQRIYCGICTYLHEAGFLSYECPNCTSETIKAKSFLSRKYFCYGWNGLAFVVSEVQFGNFSLNKPAWGHFNESCPKHLCGMYVCTYVIMKTVSLWWLSFAALFKSGFVYIAVHYLISLIVNIVD